MNIKIVVTISLFLAASFTGSAVNEVSEEKMHRVYEEIMTPEKFGMVLAPDRNNYKIDCPTVFREGDKWYMSYLVYNGQEGNDGRGYETWLAESPDLLKWKTLGRVLSFKDKGWDMNQLGGYIALVDNEWGGSYKAGKYKGEYWMTYIGGDSPGYELGVLKVGIAHTNGKINQAHEWKTYEKPAMSPQDTDNSWWESLTQYKSSVFHDKSKKLGKPFVMFYNAGGVNPETKVKGERIGIALSDNMVNWTRYAGNPVINHEGGITGDAVVQKMGDLYVLFYFSAFRPGVSHKAFNSFMCSYDLINWTDWKGEKLIYPSVNYDNMFAHKSSVIKHNGVVYHFYCAVNKDNQRGIALATSKPMGRSTLRFPEPDKTVFRTEISLNTNWKSCLDDSVWINVTVPHNWDQYYGHRKMIHGNLHGSAWYKRNFQTPLNIYGKRVFLYFEGVGSYATVFVNQKKVGSHNGGRTTFTIDVTESLKPSGENELTVRAEHPSYIADLPWVCGGCSGEGGFSEGSQPLGIFRPVTLVVTDEVRVQPFGVHLWNEKGSIKDENTEIQAETTIKNYGRNLRKIELISKLVDEDGVQVARAVQNEEISSCQEKSIRQVLTMTRKPILWSIEKPVLYTLITMIKENGKVIDEEKTSYGLRTISWPLSRKNGDNKFYLNDKAILINGTCEYEHLNGLSHSFSKKQIESRIAQVKAAGFNAFRDAHQPHNLLYKELLDKNGILQWTQFSAHIWYDTPKFRENFKNLLKEWVIERRNSPSVILWGLQNESSLPYDFAVECTELIRQLDPTTSSQRLVTTCNGGDGTDWNVVQNWSGTYGVNTEAYGKELARQLLNGEYGAWRSIDLHTEGGFKMRGLLSEDRMNHLMEQKIRFAEQYRDSICGQFHWLINSHENPGRVQNEEGFREIDRIGPFNYKGLMTPWGEPLDAFYLYRSNYAPKQTEPMLYIVSHTWPDRWTKAGIKDSIIIFSNCDSVVLFNDLNYSSLGARKNAGKGSHFQWDGEMIKYNLLFAVGYVNGKAVANDLIILNHLPKAPHFKDIYTKPLQKEHISLKPVGIKAKKGLKYIYRVNCGGGDYTDTHGQLWQADKALTSVENVWGSVSWTNVFEGLHPMLASQRSTNDPIAGTRDWKLFQTFRYGTDKLKYLFPVKPGKYQIELYFTEPWYGTGGGMTCDNWRNFDIAINGDTIIRGLDIWRESGHDVALKKTLMVNAQSDIIEISFPNITSGQAIISAIAIASESKKYQIPEKTKGLISLNEGEKKNVREILYWLNTGDSQYFNENVFFSKLPPVLFGAEWLKTERINKKQAFSIKFNNNASIYLAVTDTQVIPSGFVVTELKLENNRDEKFSLCKKQFAKGENIDIQLPGSSVLFALPEIIAKEEVIIRPDIRFEAEKARLEGPIITGLVFKDKACISVEKPGFTRMEWNVSPGLAGVYNIRFRYRNVTDKTINLKIKILTADDRILRDDYMSFPPYEEKWRVISTTTDAYINAGHYRIRLESEDATGLWMDSMDFQ